MLTPARILLAGWCAAILAAGLLTYLLDAETGTVGGAIILTWIVGYLVQFGLMLAIINATGRSNQVVPWLVASVLPWGVDWTVAGFPWLFAVWVPLTVGYAVWLDRSHDHAAAVLRTGVRGTATVLAVVHGRFQTVVNNAYIRRRLRLSVRTEKGGTFETTMTGTFAFGSEPSPGDTFAVRIDPARPNRVVVDDRTTADQRLSASGIRAGGLVRAVHQGRARDGTVRCRLELSVTQHGTGLQYGAHLDAPFPADRIPGVGDTLGLLADPDDYTHVVLAPDAEPRAY